MKIYYLKALTLLSFLLICIAAHAHDFEAQNSDGVTIYYNITSSIDKTCAVTYRGSSYSESVEYSGDLIIPETVTYNDRVYSVTKIGGYAFYGCTGLTSIEIPNSVIYITSHAFEGCIGIASIEVEQGNTYYDSRNNCNAIIEISTNTLKVGCKNTTIPNSVTKIGIYAFSGCTGLTSIEIPNSVTSIGGYAFYGCTGLTSVTLGNSVTSIDNYAFSGCTSLTSVNISDIESLCKIDFKEYSANPLYSAKKLYINGELITDIVIPSSVPEIKKYTFYNCSNLTNVTIPEGVTSIGESAFSSCTGLTSIIIPEGVTSIGESAFYRCTGLTNVTIPEGVTSIGESAFSSCTGLTNVTIPEGVTSIGESAFSSCTGLTSIIIPEGVTSIGLYAFENCTGLTSVTLGNSIASIGERAFYGTKLNICRIDAIIPPTAVSSSFPSSMSLVLVSSGCKAAYTVDAVWGTYTIIEEGSCDIEVTNEVAGELTKSIVNQTRKNLPNITSLIVHGTLNASDFEKINTSMTSLLHLDISDTDVTEIPAEIFLNKTTLMTIKLPKGLKSIGNEAFSGCKVLSGEIELPESLETIGDYAFQNCNMINGTLTIPASITSIGSSAFNGCLGINAVDMSESTELTAVNQYVFRDCATLESVTFPETVKSIGSYAFRGCKSLDNVVLPVALEVVNSSAFINCTNLKNIDFSNCIALTALNNSAFYGCTGLKLLDLTDCTSLNAINESVFSSCSSLETVNFPSSLTSIGTSAFANCTNLLHMSVPCTTPPAIENNANPFAGVDNIACVLSIPSDNFFDYYEANYWGGFVDVENKSDIQIEVTETENESDESSKPQGCKIHFKKYIEETIEPTELSMNNVKATLNEETVTIETGKAVTASGQSVFVGNGEAVTFYFTPDEGKKIDKVLYNDEDVTSELENNTYTTSAVNGMSSLQVILKKGTLTGVDDAFVEGVKAIEEARYDISGRLLSAPVKGINIVKMSDGSVKKVLVK